MPKKKKRKNRSRGYAKGRKYRTTEELRCYSRGYAKGRKYRQEQFQRLEAIVDEMLFNWDIAIFALADVIDQPGYWNLARYAYRKMKEVEKKAKKARKK